MGQGMSGTNPTGTYRLNTNGAKLINALNPMKKKRKSKRRKKK